MRSFGWYEFAGADTAVEGFPHINDVYHHISLGVPDRYRAQSGVTNTTTLRASLAAGPPRQTTIYLLAAECFMSSRFKAPPKKRISRQQ